MRLLRLLFSLSLIAATTLAVEPAKTRVALAGDSTVTDKAGWGAAFAKLLVPEAECVNLAGGGQSSKSFRDSGKWKQVIDAKPAFVLIQFGHNDMPGKGPKRETDPATTYRENMGRFIDEARAIGAQPVIVTSMARRIFDNDKLRGELKPYADAAMSVAQEKKVPVVDLYTLSVELLQKLGPAGADEFNPPHAKPGTTDRTHLNAKGADVMAGLIAGELRKVAPDLAKLLK